MFPTADRMHRGEPAGRIESMRRRIVNLLETRRGDAFISALFHDLLGYEPTDAPAPLGPPGALLLGREGGTGCEILTRPDRPEVCHVRMPAWRLGAGGILPALWRLWEARPNADILVSNPGGTQWDFWWRTPSPRGLKLRRIRLDRDVFGPVDLARLLDLRCSQTPEAPAAPDASGDRESPEAPEAPADELAGPRFRRLPSRLLFHLLPTSPLLRAAWDWESVPHRDQSRLARSAATGNTAARDALLLGNLRLVVNVAVRSRDGQLDFEDAVQEGCVGLLTAAQRFDAERGSTFAHFCALRIGRWICRSQQEQAGVVRVPPSLQDLAAKRRAVGQELVTRLGRPPTPEELAGALGASPQRVRDVEQAERALRPKGLPPTLIVACSAPGEPDFTHQAREWALTRAMEKLSDREADVLRMRFGLGGCQAMTLEEIGDQYGLTRERVRQLEARALEKLRWFFSTTAGKRLCTW